MDLLFNISMPLIIMLYGGILVYLYVKKHKKIDLLPVEAGPVDSVERDFTKPLTVVVGDLQTNPALQYYVVQNDCMIPRHIYGNDIIGVQLFDDQFTIKDIKKDDILLIYIDDEDFHGHKIRAVKDITEDAFLTYYYRGEEKHDSKKPHSFSSVKGIVRETYHPHQNVPRGRFFCH